VLGASGSEEEERKLERLRRERGNLGNGSLY